MSLVEYERNLQDAGKVVEQDFIQAPQAFLEALQREMQDEHKNMCSICLEILDSCIPCTTTSSSDNEQQTEEEEEETVLLEKSQPIYLACQHRFHYECIKQWIRNQNVSHQKPQCPVCRSEIDIPPELLQQHQSSLEAESLQSVLQSIFPQEASSSNNAATQNLLPQLIMMVEASTSATNLPPSLPSRSQLMDSFSSLGTVVQSIREAFLPSPSTSSWTTLGTTTANRLLEPLELSEEGNLIKTLVYVVNKLCLFLSFAFAGMLILCWFMYRIVMGRRI